MYISLLYVLLYYCYTCYNVNPLIGYDYHCPHSPRSFGHASHMMNKSSSRQ